MVYYKDESVGYYGPAFTHNYTLKEISGNFLSVHGTATNFWVRLHSIAYGDYHYPMFDFDERVDVFDIARRQGLEGHVYKTLHGWHFFADGLMKLEEIALYGTLMGVDEAYIRISRERGFFAIRCGRKQGRDFDDIQYIGHTSGEERKKSLFLNAHDGLCSTLTRIYKYRGARPLFESSHPFQFEDDEEPESKEDIPW
jgi:hypothetical protein